jgi:hypothetical protein
MAHRLGGRNVGLEANREEDLVAGAVLRERGRNGTCMEKKMVVIYSGGFAACEFRLEPFFFLNMERPLKAWMLLIISGASTSYIRNLKRRENYSPVPMFYMEDPNRK